MADSKKYSDPNGNVYVAPFEDEAEERAWVEQESNIARHAATRQRKAA